MKILHMMLSCFYIDDYNYQENVLPKQNAVDGHEVKIIASTETFIHNQKLGYVPPSIYRSSEGIEVQRVPYRRWLPHFMMKKIRSYPNIYPLIEQFHPDIILFHGVPAYELLTVTRYKKYHPGVRLYVDSHEDKHNSGQNFISRMLLHRGFYRFIISKAIPNIDKILYISDETKDFLSENYHIPEDLMEFYPLGGAVFSVEERNEKRRRKRKELGLREHDILFVHSGKLDVQKRTVDLLTAFSSVPDSRFKLVLIGSIPQDGKERIDSLIKNDPRISFLGWKSTDELLSYLCACDMYLQPGSQSATMQNALCAFAPVMLYPHKSHKPYFRNNGYFVTTVNDMVQSFLDISSHPNNLKIMSSHSEELAKDLLDYRKLAARLYVTGTCETLR